MPARKSERGAAAIAVTLLLLFGVTLAVFFANRSLIFEQKTAANQQRATAAFEAAEAGLEWALARLNDSIFLGAAPSCAPATGVSAANRTFRQRYVVPTASPTRFAPPADSRVGCSISANGVLTCSCTAPGVAPVLGTSTDARFLVAFNAVAGDPLAVEIVSRGCTSRDRRCDIGVTDTADAVAVSRIQIKLVPTFANAPAAALTTGGATNVTGNLSVVNYDVTTNGITINAGAAVAQGSGTNVSTLPGTPPSASILDADASLQALSTADLTGDLFFQSFFGTPMEAFRSDPRTKVINAGDCGGAASCGALVSSWYDKGFQQFWLDPDVAFNNANLPAAGTLGTSDRPIYLAGAGNLELKSNLVAYGMLYAATATATENWDYSGSGSATIFGAMVSRGAFNKGSGTLNVVYDPSVFGMGGVPSGLLVRVPGSWRDSDSVY